MNDAASKKTLPHSLIEEILAKRLAPEQASLLAREVAEELGFVPDASLPEESAADIYARCLDSGAKWAAAFARTAKRIGAGTVDEDWLMSWFANAIEQATDYRKIKLRDAPIEVGAAVVLRSGGPLMVVSRVFDGVAQCTWIDGADQVQTAPFPVCTIYTAARAPRQECGVWYNGYLAA
jgi:uncharacterized protein YodC (DUF2158 family)